MEDTKTTDNNAAVNDTFKNQLEEWKKKYGDIYRVTGELDDETSLEFIFRKPARKDLARFAQEMQKDLIKATNNLVYNCLLYPDASVVQKMVEEKPGMILALGGELQKLIGSNIDFLSTRL